MKPLPILFVGIFAALAFSWTGLALVNHITIGQLDPIPEGGVEAGASTIGEVLYPRQRSGLAQHGAVVYAEHGCYTCHTQQVRARDMGSDIARNLGVRQSVARDYIREARTMLGTLRAGPDLANIGVRMPEANRLYVHLYNARIHEPHSMMPPYDFLFEKHALEAGKPAPETALVFPDELPETVVLDLQGKAIVPSDDARALVAYLQSLSQGYTLPEAAIIEEE